MADLEATQQLSQRQYIRLNTEEDAVLMETVILTNQVAVALAKIYQRGFKVDVDTLDNVKTEFQNEKIAIDNWRK